MRMKKLLAAAGIVSVVAPAALAASAIMGRGQAFETFNGRIQEALGNALALAGLETLLADRAGPPEGRLPPHAGPQGKGLLLADLIGPRISDFDHLKVDFGGPKFGGVEPAGGGISAGGSPFGMPEGGPSSPGQRQQASGAGGPLGVGGAFGAGNGLAAAGQGLAAGGGLGAGGGGGSGLGGGLDGSGGGASDAPGESTNDGALIELDQTAGASTGAPVTPAPLPPSFWMMLAGLVGLGYLGRRRG